MNQQALVYRRIEALSLVNNNWEISRGKDIDQLNSNMKDLFAQLQREVQEEGARNRALVEISKNAEKCIEYSVEQLTPFGSSAV